eukprot:GHVN01060978.1.p1 GENE.GHVN01060978.1~~GHVN01060978.1.p1  ORF type:complete len:260 (-),score=37.32 GHVN01060978.1:544-1323(-)
MFGSFGGRRRPQSPSSTHWQRVFACYARETISNGHFLGNKILLPQQAFEELANMIVTWPLLFKLECQATGRFTHCGVLEFTSPVGICYVPASLMSQLGVADADHVNVTNVSLPKGTYVKLQPCSVEFLDLDNPRVVLEQALRNFAALTKGDIINIEHIDKTFNIEIIECRPAAAISVIETDVEVDFAPPQDYVEPTPNATVNVPVSSAQPWMDKLEGGVRRIPPPKNDQRVRDGKIRPSSHTVASSTFEMFGGKGRSCG